jgi:dsDNA-specific endonuclease/ATPase MutS2
MVSAVTPDSKSSDRGWWVLQAESEELLQQTSEALNLELKFGTAYNLHPAVRAVEEGTVLNARQLYAVAVTLQTAASLKEQVGSGEATSAGKSSDQGPV